MIKVTYTLSDLSDEFYYGMGDLIVGLLNMSPRRQLGYLARYAHGELAHCIKQQISTGQMRDLVELNDLLRDPDVPITFELEPRKGYKLATFLIGR